VRVPGLLQAGDCESRVHERERGLAGQRAHALMIVAYTAEPGSRSAEALGLLASWAATDEVRDETGQPRS